MMSNNDGPRDQKFHPMLEIPALILLWAELPQFSLERAIGEPLLQWLALISASN
jgi:hypothetical protein